jgi:hypothetical protein
MLPIFLHRVHSCKDCHILRASLGRSNIFILSPNNGRADDIVVDTFETPKECLPARDTRTHKQGDILQSMSLTMQKLWRYRDSSCIMACSHSCLYSYSSSPDCLPSGMEQEHYHQCHVATGPPEKRAGVSTYYEYWNHGKRVYHQLIEADAWYRILALLCSI